MSTITIQEIQRDPLSFVKRIEAGEALLVVRDVSPIAEVRPLSTIANGPRPFGLCAGQFTVPDDFDQPLPEDILEKFESAIRQSAKRDLQGGGL